MITDSFSFPFIPFPYISRHPSAAQNIKGAQVQVQQSQVAEGRGTHASRGKFWEAQRLYGTLPDGSHATSTARRVSNWGDVQSILDNLWCTVLMSLEILMNLDDNGIRMWQNVSDSSALGCFLELSRMKGSGRKWKLLSALSPSRQGSHTMSTRLSVPIRLIILTTLDGIRLWFPVEDAAACASCASIRSETREAHRKSVTYRVLFDFLSDLRASGCILSREIVCHTSCLLNFEINRTREEQVTRSGRSSQDLFGIVIRDGFWLE